MSTSCCGPGLETERLGPERFYELISIEILPECVVEDFRDDAGKKWARDLETGICVDLDERQLEILI